VPARSPQTTGDELGRLDLDPRASHGRRPNGRRYLLLVHLDGDRTAAGVRRALVAAMLHLPATLRRSLTWDQGAEMAEHHTFTMATKTPVYFCDPASPWQRRTNENTVSLGLGPGGLGRDA
jgi:hypothetical protein